MKIRIRKRSKSKSKSKIRTQSVRGIDADAYPMPSGSLVVPSGQTYGRIDAMAAPRRTASASRPSSRIRASAAS